MIRLWAIMIWVSVALTGCTTERWVQDGKMANEANQAVLACEQSLAPKPKPFVDPVYVFPDSHRLQACMEAKGYTLIRQ